MLPIKDEALPLPNGSDYTPPAWNVPGVYMDIHPSRIYHVEEAAEILGTTPGALRFQISKGKAPKSAKIMGRRVFRGADLIAFIKTAFADEAPEPDPKGA